MADYHDIGEELVQIGDKLVAEGKMVATAVSDLVEHKAKFDHRNGVFVELASGVKAEAGATALLAGKPHWQPRVITDDAEAAFGRAPTLAARGAYLRDHGEHAYNEEMKRWGASPINLKPGTGPANGDDQPTKKNGTADHRKNPWADDGTGKFAPGAIRYQGELVKHLGAEKAASIAASVGCTLGSI
jgi:hypothetical protein